MIEKQRNNAFVIGTYQLAAGPVHALTIHDNPHRREAPLKTICGSFQRVHYASPFADPVDMADLSSVTCKRCLQILKQKSLLRIKKARENKLIELPVELLGTYNHDCCWPIHALVKREPRPSDNPAVGVPPLRSLCKSYPDVYRADYPPRGHTYSALASRITCKECLKIMKKKGLLLEKDFPPMHKVRNQKKFFLVFYDGGTVDNIYDFKELLQDAHRFKHTINKILLIESYKEIAVEEITVVTDEDGNKVTEGDL